ncbi:sulfatase family protein [Nocardioides euryhalodurans]|nr:sulfatase [Nocardioides euryhalodurans]
MRFRARKLFSRKAVVAAAAALVTGLGHLGPVPGDASGKRVEAAERQAARQPNIIFFLTDDMSSRHLRHMPNTRKLIFGQGASFTGFHANVPLCCPARASILTGKYAHNTGVLGNAYPGGFHGFHVGDEASRTFALALQQAGYHTSLMGKYLNGYPFMRSTPEHAVEPTYVPPGWSDWAVPIRRAFTGRNYDLNLNGEILRMQGPRNYLGDHLHDRAMTTIRRNRDRRGLALFLSFFGPHNPAPASPRERRDQELQRRVATLRAPRTPDFNEADVSDKPAYVRDLPVMGRQVRDELDAAFRRQVVSLTSIDRYVGDVVDQLRRSRQLRNTYLVFTSDHGYRLGAHRLKRGKNSPYLPDVRVPLGIRGPGIAPGTRVDALAANIDLAPTFAAMAGLTLPYVHDGESLLPLAQGEVPDAWRRYLYLHRGNVSPYATSPRGLREPATRMEQATEVRIPYFEGVVSRTHTYVVYETGEEELYDTVADPHQLENLLAPGGPGGAGVRAEMRVALARLAGCVGVEGCRVR